MMKSRRRSSDESTPLYTIYFTFSDGRNLPIFEVIQFLDLEWVLVHGADAYFEALVESRLPAPVSDHLSYLLVDLFTQQVSHLQMEEASLRVAVKYCDDAAPFLRCGKSFVMAQFPSKQKVDVETVERGTSGASAYTDSADFNVAFLPMRNALWSCDGQTLHVSNQIIDTQIVTCPFDQGSQ